MSKKQWDEQKKGKKRIVLCLEDRETGLNFGDRIRSALTPLHRSRSLTGCHERVVADLQAKLV